jgi:uncharacterized membrane protein YkvA (DUF1232 family)
MAIEGIPREARLLWKKLLEEPRVSDAALRREVEDYAKLIEKVAREKEFFDKTTATRLAALSLRLLGAWAELDGEQQRLAQAAIRYFVLSEDGDDDFESPTGFDDDHAVMTAVLRHLGKDAWVE